MFDNWYVVQVRTGKEEEIDKFIYCLKEVLDSIKKQR